LSATVKELLKLDSICQSYAQVKESGFWLALELENSQQYVKNVWCTDVHYQSTSAHWRYM